jgi:DNA-binding response OmpR family regulator
MSAKLLVVDDEKDVVDVLTRHLEAAGYEVLAARDGVDALHKARTALPDLILLDLLLDDLDGLSVCEILRCQPSTKTIPVLILTALADEMSRAQGLAAGASDYLPKPFSPSELRERVSQLLQTSKQSTTDEPDAADAATTP